MTNAEARFNKSLRPRKPDGSLGRTAEDVHLDSHTAPELWPTEYNQRLFICTVFFITGWWMSAGLNSDETEAGYKYTSQCFKWQ